MDPRERERGRFVLRMSGGASAKKKVCEATGCDGDACFFFKFCIVHICKDRRCKRKAEKDENYCEKHQKERDQPLLCLDCGQPTQKGSKSCLQCDLAQLDHDNEQFTAYMGQFEGAVLKPLSDSAGVVVVSDGEAPQGAAAGPVRKAAVVIDVTSDNEAADESLVPVAPPAPPAVDAAPPAPAAVDAGDAAAAGVSDEELRDAAGVLRSLDAKGRARSLLGFCRRGGRFRDLPDPQRNPTQVLGYLRDLSWRYHPSRRSQSQGDDEGLLENFAALAVREDTVARLETKASCLRSYVELCGPQAAGDAQPADLELDASAALLLADFEAFLAKKRGQDGQK